MFRYVSLNHIMFRYVSLNHIMFRYVSLNHIMFRYVSLNHIMFRYVSLNHIMFCTLRCMPSTSQFYQLTQQFQSQLPCQYLKPRRLGGIVASEMSIFCTVNRLSRLLPVHLGCCVCAYVCVRVCVWGGGSLPGKSDSLCQMCRV